MQLGREYLQDALSILKELLKSNPQDFKALRALADCLLKMENFSQAIKCYEKLLDVTDEVGGVYLQIARGHLHLNDFENAEAYVLKSVEHGETSDGYCLLAEVYFKWQGT